MIYVRYSDLERDNRCLLRYWFSAIPTVAQIRDLYSEVGEVRSIKMKMIGKNLVAEIEFSTFISVALAVAMAVRDGIFESVLAKRGIIFVDSFPDVKVTRPIIGHSYLNVLNHKIKVMFFHIPMAEDWLCKIFRVFGAIEYIDLFPQDQFGYAFVQFNSIENARAAICLDKKLKFTRKNKEVEMRVMGCDLTELCDDGKLDIVK